MHQLQCRGVVDILQKVYSLGFLYKMRFFGHILSLILLFSLLSCEVKVPENIIPPEKMEAFLYDYHLVQSMNGQYSSDEYREKLFYSYIFKKHNIEKLHFDSSMMWYNRYPKHLKRIYENLEAKLNAEVDRLNESENIVGEGVSLETISLADDSVNLWTGLKLKYLSSTSLNNKLVFSFYTPEDTTFVKNDSLSFSFSAFLLDAGNHSVKQRAYASIRLEYADGMLFTKSAYIDSCGYYNLSAPRNPDSRLKSMSGFVYYADDDSTARAGLLLSDISVLRMHPVVENKD